ncbi:hypothetical protein AGMMS49543_04800 [Betaproteobacteria bacterium]|nr:hypothetical protein AGMMS49543_04800 [Betaproteobacteria bacterium]GHU08939.1 hypothetical protein AGMMS50225_08560 [Betaproteobacteria bacterium]GHU20389.1 hypothetical protein AGMMS50243_14900 [Betaproteobacteria bacterium]
MSDTPLDRLVDLLRQAPAEVFLQPHNVPDPDAIASCMGLQCVLGMRGVDTVIVYDHKIEKANAINMLKIFNVDMLPAGEVHTLGEKDWAVLVDGQKGNSNLTDLPTDEVAVIDHHEYLGNQGYRFEDVRPEVGSCSAIIAEYFFANQLVPPNPVASALLYGIYMDTNNLSRKLSRLDLDMFYKLYAFADMSVIAELRTNALSLEDLRLYADAFRGVEVHGEIGFLCVSEAHDALIGAASDIVLSVIGVNIVVAYAIRAGGVKLSVRSARKEVPANALVRALVDGIGLGGGHDHMAGGFIPAENLTTGRGEIGARLKQRALAFFGRCCARARHG